MANYFNGQTIIYHNGAFVKAADAKIDLYSQTLHYGFGVFEGIRSYKTVSGSARIFKPVEHYNRLEQSARALHLPYHWNTEELVDITYSLLEQNDQQDAYIRPLIYSPANMSFNRNEESFIVIETWKMEPFLGEKLLNVMVSAFQRPNPAAFHIEAKATGHYVNSILASQDAKAKGFDEALLTDMHGHVAEGPGANMFFEKDGKLFTPAAGHILPGITRATVLEIASRLGIAVEIKTCTVEELKSADSAFFCGTAAEVIGWQRIDDYTFPVVWQESLGRKIQQAYKNLVIEAGIKQKEAATA